MRCRGHILWFVDVGSMHQFDTPKIKVPAVAYSCRLDAPGVWAKTSTWRGTWLHYIFVLFLTPMCCIDASGFPKPYSVMLESIHRMEESDLLSHEKDASRYALNAPHRANHFCSSRRIKPNDSLLKRETISWVVSSSHNYIKMLVEEESPQEEWLSLDSAADEPWQSKLCFSLPSLADT